MPITTCVFDAYGTLFDVSAAAREAAAEPGREALAEKANDLAVVERLTGVAQRPQHHARATLPS